MKLHVEKRDIVGTGLSALRAEGLIPAELYGKGVENIHLSVPSKEFVRVFRESGENTVVDVVVGDDTHPAVIHGVSRDPKTNDVISVDFYRVRLDEKITVNVPLSFTGESPAVKEKGGLLVKSLHELEIEALPNQIPHEIEVSVSSLTEIGDSIYVKDISIPEGVEVLTEDDVAVASVTEKAEEEEQESLSVEDVKVEGEEKKAERDAAREDASSTDAKENS